MVVAYVRPEAESVHIGGDVLAHGARTADPGVSVVEASALELGLGETASGTVLKHDPQQQLLVDLGAHHRLHLPVTVVDEVGQHPGCGNRSTRALGVYSLDSDSEET